METMKMHCPSCQAKLTVPEAASGKAARCPFCKKVFRVPSPDDVLDDTISCWLEGEGEDEEMLDDQPAQHAASPQSDADSADSDADAQPAPAKPAPTAAASAAAAALSVESHPASPTDSKPQSQSPADSPADSAAVVGTATALAAVALKDEFRQIHWEQTRLSILNVTTAGVTLAFASANMALLAFRASMPMRCINCRLDDPRQLIARPLAWIDRAHGRYANTGDIEAKYEIHLRSHASQRDVLADMRPIDELPAPFHLPMPYFVCTRCSPDVLVNCQTVASAVGVHAEVLIPTGHYALEWLGRVNGVCGEEYTCLEQLVATYEADAWRAIAEDVRRRISVWFDILPGEKFLRYASDSDFARKDHGLSGIVLTDQRLVFCKYHNQGIIPLDSPGQLTATKDGPFYDLAHQNEKSRKKIIRLRREDANELAQLLQDIACPLQLVWL